MTTRSWIILDCDAGFQPITDTSTTQQHAIGTIVIAKHTTYGVAEFMYAKGVASTVVGDVCMIDTYANTTTRCVAATRGIIGVAMSINVANQYGWYQISGSAVVKAGTVAAQGLMYSTATAGTVDDAAVAGSYILGACFKTADGTPAAGFAVAALSRPFMGGTPT